jgi:hypothetical protein
MEVIEKREAWNKGKLVGQKPPSEAEGHLAQGSRAGARIMHL